MEMRTAIAAVGIIAGFLATVVDAGTNTVAYWRFENGTNGEERPQGLNYDPNWEWNQWYTDSSGNGNHLSTWGSTSRPTATNACPFKTVPQTGATNSLALDFDGSDDLGTFGAQTLGKMVESYMFSNGWTVECSFRLDALYWEVLVGKDGKRAAGTEAPFWLKILDSNKKLECLFIDDSDNIHYVQTINPIQVGTWYSVAATYDNTTFKLYLKGEGDAGYVLQSSAMVTAGGRLGQYDRTWTIGRGMHNGGAVDFVDGIIDEVRISNIALEPAKFLQSAGDFPVLPSDGPVCHVDAGQLSWNSSSNSFYAVERSPNLIPNDWRTVTNGIAAISDTNSVSLPPFDQDSEFFRVVASNGVWPIPEKTVVLTFDDAVQSHLDFVAPLLTNHGFNATFFVCELWMYDTANFMTWEDIGEIHAMGFEIGNHSRSHAGFSRADSAETLRSELAYVEGKLAAVGVPKPVSFGWPNNDFGPESLQVLVEEGYRFARRGAQPEEPYGHVRMGPLYDPNAYDPLLIPTTADAYPDWTLDHFKKIMAHSTPGQVVVLQFHGVPDIAHPWVHCDPVLFEQCMNYLEAEGYNVIALRDLESYIDFDHETNDPALQKRYPFKL